jgi:hypothetical protein
MAPAQLITRMTELLKDKNFYKPVKFCREDGPPPAAGNPKKKPSPNKGKGSI